MKGTLSLYTTLMDHANRIAAGRRSPYEEVPLPKSPQLVNVVRDAVPFEISNLIHKNEERLFGKSLFDLFKDLPKCVPPYLHTWFEFIYAGEPVAMYVTTVRREDDDEQAVFWEEAKDEAVHAVPVGGFISRGIVVRGNGIRSISQMLVLSEAVFEPDGTIQKTSDSIYVDRFVPHEWLERLNEPYEPEVQAQEKDFVITCFYDCLFASALMHCRNVAQVDTVLPRQLARARERKSLTKIVYKTLVIDPGKTPRKAKPGPGEKVMKRQHTVRGHFAEYGWNEDKGDWYRWPDGTPKGLLFGKYHGEYWIPEMVRGDDETGFVVKDYRIKGGAL